MCFVLEQTVCAYRDVMFEDGFVCTKHGNPEGYQLELTYVKGSVM